VDEAFVVAAIALIVDEYWRRNLVIIPRVILMILEVTFDSSGRNIQGDSRRCVKVIAGTLVTDRRSAIARSPIREISFGVVVACYPHRGASGLPLVAVGPCVAARLSGRGDGESAP